MIIKIKEITKRSMLFSADKGIELRNIMYELINKKEETKIVKIDMLDIETIDSSFCREAFVKLIGLMLSNSDKPQIIFENATSTVKDNLHESFTNWDKIGIVKTNDNKYHTIGKSSQPLNDTINVMIKLKETNTKVLSEKLNGIPLTTINNRLKSLYDMCIISRRETSQESGGKEYIYSLEG